MFGNSLLHFAFVLDPSHLKIYWHHQSICSRYVIKQIHVYWDSVILEWISYWLQFVNTVNPFRLPYHIHLRITYILMISIGIRRMTRYQGDSLSHGRQTTCPILTEYTRSHYDDVIMGTMASHITSLTTVYWTVYSDADKKRQSSASLAFVWGIHRGPMNSPHKCPVMRKMFLFDDVIMAAAPWLAVNHLHQSTQYQCIWPILDWHWLFRSRDCYEHHINVYATHKIHDMIQNMP